MQPLSIVHRVLFALAPFACASLVLAPMSFAQAAEARAQRSQSGAGASVAPEVRRAVADLEALARAQQILQERGYVREAARLEDIRNELAVKARTASVEARAESLLTGDIHDQAVRVGILELATEGYAAAGWETNAEALGWFTAMGQRQRDGANTEVRPMPASVTSGSGTIIDRMIELVLGAGAVHQQRGNPLAAECCLRLGRFYVQRDLGAFRTDEGAAKRTAPEEPVVPDGAEPIETPVERLQGLGYFGDTGAAQERATPVNAARLELVREIQALRARIEELQQRLSQQPQQPRQQQPVRESRER